ncbi:hypothetical protein X801_03400 [Opisthorchis viverrini]|uniref:AGC-kinase C-terminal domain-containing protein n=1 Tax=Opisthorchis viverrini TaxID=6198 RepID=A0A1S8X1X5_OPIVI|nr:hypothetical protein X801_03400 [Opisthorchis viverrini]
MILSEIRGSIIRMRGTERMEELQYKFTPFFTAEAKDLVRNLLQADLTRRFGNLKNGTNDIKQHKWFSSVNWVATFKREFYTTRIGDTLRPISGCNLISCKYAKSLEHPGSRKAITIDSDISIGKWNKDRLSHSESIGRNLAVIMSGLVTVYKVGLLNYYHYYFPLPAHMGTAIFATDNSHSLRKGRQSCGIFYFVISHTFSTKSTFGIAEMMGYFSRLPS